MSITFCDAQDSVPMTGAVGGLDEGTVVEFAAGLPGFPAARQFRVEDLGEALRPFGRLRSVGEPEISFTVVDPGLLFAHYTVEIDDEHQAALAISDPADVVTLVMITVPRPPQPPTANLLGPIVINRRTGAAAQVVQHRSAYKVAEPLPTVAR